LNQYETLEWAIETLSLHDRITLGEIKSQYKNLMKLWHPDRCKDTPEQCKEKAQKITQAYQLLLEYCHNYRYSFTPSDIEAQLSGDAWWMSKFGDQHTTKKAK
jgi:DnaJ-class molecular chaperone